MHWGSGWWHAGGMWVFWILVILLTLWLVRVIARRARPPEKSAEEILRDRFARGEIDREEYEEKLRALREG